MSFMVNPYRFASAAFSYPYSMPVINPGAETGNETGWTQNYGDFSGTGFSVSSADTAGLGFSGTYHFRLSINDQWAEVNQAVDFPSNANSDIDDGLAQVTLTFLANGFSPTDTDWGTFRLEFFSGSAGAGTFLGQRSTQQIDRDLSVSSESHTWTVPRGSRSVVIYVYGRKLAGGELSFYWDDVAISLALSGETVESVFVDRGADTSGWTITVGSGQPTTNSTWCNWRWPGLTPGSLAAWEGYKELNVSSLSATAQSEIAAGNATLFLNRYAWNENDDDKSRTWIECLDSGGSVVATVQDGAASSAWVVGESVHLVRDSSVAVPTTTTKFRKNMRFDRVDGTVLDAAVGFLDCYIKW